MRNFDFRKYGDNLLFALAMAVLITALLYSFIRRDRESQPTVTSVVFTHWWHEDIDEDVLRNIIAEFENSHEGIRIILNEKSYESLHFDLFDFAEEDETQAPAPPGDVIALDPLWVPGLLNRGVIESAEVPILSFINVLYYNIEILREAGFTRPPNTRNEFLTFARAVAANRENRMAYALGLGLGGSRGIHNNVYPWIWAAGARLINNGNPVVTSAPVVQSLTFLASLSSEGLIAPGAFYADSRKKLEDFVSGRTAFMIAPTRHIGFVREQMGDAAFNITSVPLLDNQTGTPFFSPLGWTLGIHSASAHMEEARLFSAFLAGRASYLSNSASGTIPASSPQDPFYSNIWEIALAGETALDFSGLAAEPVLEEIFREELSALFAGTASPAETAAAIQQRWLAVLREDF